jgi:hypothetical protein
MIHNAVIVSANGMKCCILKKFSGLISDAMMPLHRTNLQVKTILLEGRHTTPLHVCTDQAIYLQCTQT